MTDWKEMILKYEELMRKTTTYKAFQLLLNKEAYNEAVSQIGSNKFSNTKIVSDEEGE